MSACGEPQRYDYKSSGRYFYVLAGLRYVDGQIVYCHNGRCPLRYKPMHPPKELTLAPPSKGHGFDVIACVGRLRYGERLTRPEIKTRLAFTDGGPQAQVTVRAHYRRLV